MIELDAYKKALEDSGLDDLSEVEILKLREQQDQMAEVFFSMWQDELNDAKDAI